MGELAQRFNLAGKMESSPTNDPTDHFFLGLGEGKLARNDESELHEVVGGTVFFL